jgi:single-strand DNA-binding protein
MTKGVEAAFSGRLGGDPQERVSAKGAAWASFTVAVEGNEEQTTWVRVAVFGDVAQRVAAELRKGCQVYVEGSLRLSEWRDKRTGELRHGLEVAAWRVEAIGLIGERRPKKPREGHEEGSRRPAGASDGQSRAASENDAQGLPRGPERVAQTTTERA